MRAKIRMARLFGQRAFCPARDVVCSAAPSRNAATKLWFVPSVPYSVDSHELSLFEKLKHFHPKCTEVFAGEKKCSVDIHPSGSSEVPGWLMLRWSPTQVNHPARLKLSCFFYNSRLVFCCNCLTKKTVKYWCLFSTTQNRLHKSVPDWDPRCLLLRDGIFIGVLRHEGRRSVGMIHLSSQYIIISLWVETPWMNLSHSWYVRLKRTQTAEMCKPAVRHVQICCQMNAVLKQMFAK